MSMNISSKQLPNGLDMCSQIPPIHNLTPTPQKQLRTLNFSLCVSALSLHSVCLLLIPCSVIWVLISAALCHRVSLALTLPLQQADSPPPFASVSFSPNAVTPCFLVRLYLHAPPRDLEYVSHGGDGEQFH